MRLTYEGKAATVGMEETRTSMERVAATSGKLSTQYSAAAMSAKQLSMATRQLPMQFTDIVTSLASGQSPMLVLLQQGGQIKDQFGGVGNAAKAMGGYIASLINPIGLVTGAVLAGGAAWYYWGNKAEEATKKARDELAKLKKDADAAQRLSDQERLQQLRYRVQSAELDAKYFAKLRDDTKRSQEERLLAGQQAGEARRLASGLEKQAAELEAEIAKKSAQETKKKTDAEKVYASALAETNALLARMRGDFDRQVQARERGMQVMSESERALAAEMDKIDKSADAVRVSVARSFADGHLSGATYRDTLAKINAETDRQRDAVKRLQAEQDELNGSWEYGALVAMRKYQDEAANTAALTERAFGSSMKGMENAEVEFIKKNKADWRSLSDAILTEILRIQVAKMNAGLFGNLSGILSNIGGSGSTSSGSDGWNPDYSLTGTRASGGPVSANSLYRVNERGPEILHQDGNDYLMMGGRGGYVKPLGSETSNGGGGGNVSIVINNHSGQPATTREATDGRGNRSIEVVIGDLAASELARPGSSMHRTMRGSFGVQPAMVSR
jgi:lambda family phage tail tape measure protein